MKFSILVVGIAVFAAGAYAPPAPNVNPVDAALLISRVELCGFAKTLKTRDEVMKHTPACKRSPLETVGESYDSLPCAWTLKKARDNIMERDPACKRSPSLTADDGYDSLPCAWTLKKSRDEIMERNPACKRSPVETVDDSYDSLPCAWTLKKSRRDEILERTPLMWSGLKMSRTDLNIFVDELERRLAEC
jgi:hypothetical protein